MKGKKRIRPFYCGTQYLDWEASNCERCKKGSEPEGDLPLKCEIQEALTVAYLDDGTVSSRIAERMGITKETDMSGVWCCSEVDWTEEWKARFAAGER